MPDHAAFGAGSIDSWISVNALPIPPRTGGGGGSSGSGGDDGNSADAGLSGSPADRSYDDSDSHDGVNGGGEGEWRMWAAYGDMAPYDTGGYSVP